MSSGRVTHRTVRSLALSALVTALSMLGACDRPGRPSATHDSPPAPPADGAATAVLATTFASREAIGSGSGELRPQLGNTLARTPDDVLSVTFAFVCTGGSSVTFRFTVGGVARASPSGAQPCDGSVFQHSIDLPEPSPVGFDATVTAPARGGYAYGYYTEKKRS